jgi:hypothetical protein
MDTDDLQPIDHNTQWHHTRNRLRRTTRGHVLADHSDEALLRMFGLLAEAYGLPYDLPVPPSGFPGFYHAKPDPEVMEIIREGARYLFAIANGEKRTLWNIHKAIKGKLNEAYQQGHADCEAQAASKSDAEWRGWSSTRHQRERGAKVYFIQSAGSEIKIGKAVDVQSRLKGLQTSHPHALTILAITDGGKAQEAEYHARFAVHRLHGEWFSPHPDILAEIDRLNSVPPSFPATGEAVCGAGR